MNRLKKFAVSSLAATAVMVAPLTAYAGFYPADRQTYTCVNGNQCAGADHVVFDSFVNNPVVGDERPFFAGSLNGANVQDRIKVKNGDVVVLRAYVHNNADPNKIGVAAATAHNVKIKVLIPTAKQSDQNLVAFISAANANPGTINDTMSLYGDRAFTLQYVSGSAVFTHKPDGVNQVADKLNDTIVGSNGTFLGDMHGCFQYSGYVTLKVKVNMPSKPPVTPPKTPPKTPPTTTTTTPTSTPTTLVNTGPGDVIGAFAAVSAAGALGYRVYLSRRLARQ